MRKKTEEKERGLIFWDSGRRDGVERKCRDFALSESWLIPLLPLSVHPFVNLRISEKS